MTLFGLELSANAQDILLSAGWNADRVAIDVGLLRKDDYTPDELLDLRVDGCQHDGTIAGWAEYVQAVAAKAGVSL